MIDVQSVSAANLTAQVSRIWGSICLEFKKQEKMLIFYNSVHQLLNFFFKGLHLDLRLQMLLSPFSPLAHILWFALK